MKKTLTTLLALALCIVLTLVLSSCEEQPTPSENPGGNTGDNTHEHTAADPVRENEIEGTCIKEGSYEKVVYCLICNEEIERTTHTIPPAEHTPSEPIEENVIDSTCYTEGKKDTAVYCSVSECHKELSRKTEIIEKKQHSPLAAVEENRIEATYEADGSYELAVYCSIDKCHAELERTKYILDMLEHNPDEPVIENQVSATCTEDGSYDEVIYCSDESCKAEIRRETKIIESEGHNYVNGICGVCKEPDPEYDSKYSEGLEFTSNGDGTCSLTGLGTCTDIDLVIPPTSPVGDVVKAISQNAFISNGGVSVTSVKIPKTVISIDSLAFARLCSSSYSLKTITVDENNSAYSSLDGILYDKDRKTLLTYPNGKNTPDFIIPDGVTSISTSAFLFVMSLQTITIPEEVINIAPASILYCLSIKNISVAQSNTAYQSIDGNLYSKDGKELLLYAPAQEETEHSVLDSVTDIWDGAFMFARNLKKIILTENLKTIGSLSFMGCSNLEEINMPDSVTSIGDGALYFCKNLKAVNIPNGVENIPHDCFAMCGSLTRVVIPNSVKTIEQYAFDDCVSISSVVIGKNVTEIHPEAFRGCWRISEIVNNSDIEVVEDESYDSLWHNLWSKAIEIHTGESKIVDKDGYLFYSYSGVNYLLCYEGEDTRLILPESYNGANYVIHDYAFNCYSSAGSTFNRGYTEIVIPDSVTSIGFGAFWFCGTLEKAIIGSGVVTIEANAFMCCENLNCLVIPDSVQTIDEWAFSSCYSITDVYYTGNEEDWATISIGSYNDYLTNATIHYNYIPEE